MNPRFDSPDTEPHLILKLAPWLCAALVLILGSLNGG